MPCYLIRRRVRGNSFNGNVAPRCDGFVFGGRRLTCKMTNRVQLVRLLATLWLALCLLVSSGCRRAYDVGDHVLIEWEGETYPGVIIDIPGPGKVKVHYDGYDELWDEVVPRSRLKGRIEEGQEVPAPQAPKKVRRTAVEAAKTNRFKIGDRVKVD
ncbi:MAG TPA: hypothetical protein ENK23_00245, partial [Sorangium sp.]|nr:hypothetical protein [Sorangium sp.]